MIKVKYTFRFILRIKLKDGVVPKLEAELTLCVCFKYFLYYKKQKK